MFFRTLSISLILLLFSSTMALAGKRLDHIFETKTLRVGTPGDYRPFSLLENGKYEGYDISIIEKMAKILGVSVQYVPTVWANIKKDYLADAFDVCIGGVSRTVDRMAYGDFLPAYAPYGKVALILEKNKERFNSFESINSPGVRIMVAPGGTNESFVLNHFTKATLILNKENAVIPGFIALGKADVMITETFEAIVYVKKNPALYAAFLNKPLSRTNYLGFFIQKDDPDFTRVMNFTWDLLEKRGELKKSTPLMFQ